jgi:hypothetical protein
MCNDIVLAWDYHDGNAVCPQRLGAGARLTQKTCNQHLANFVLDL